MIIELGKVSVNGSRYVGEDPEDILDLGREKHLKVAGPVRYDLFVEKVGRELIVRGTVSTDFSLECSRCAEFFSTTVRDLDFLRAYEISENTEAVDITSDIREDILLDLPAYPLCAQDCKGLCSQCGSNLNRGACACKPVASDDRWTGLNRLKLS